MKKVWKLDAARYYKECVYYLGCCVCELNGYCTACTYGCCCCEILSKEGDEDE